MADSNQQTGTTTFQLVLAWGFCRHPLTLGVLQDARQRDEAVPVEEQQHGRRFLPAPGRRRRFFFIWTLPVPKTAHSGLNLQISRGF